MSQTSIQQNAAIRIGSVRVLIGDTVGALVDIGALRNPVITSLSETQSIEFDNVNPLRKFVKGLRMQIKFDLAEINLTNMAKLDGGILNLSTQAASPVVVTAEAKGTGWTVAKPIAMNYKNGDNTIVASITVKQAGSSLTLNTDYKTYVSDGTNGVLGFTYVVPLTAQAAAITFDYTYTPNASKTVTFNDSGTKALKYMRLVNTDANSKTFQIDIQNGTNFAPISMDFAGDLADDVAVFPVDFQGDIVSIIDQQQTT